MNSFPTDLTPSNCSSDDWKNKKMYIHYISLLRQDIYEFLLTCDLVKDFYDIQSFFNRYNISEQNSDLYVNSITYELQQLGWYIYKVFNDTGLLICKSENDAKQSIWSTSIDITEFL